jgi:hypothetical protein
VNRQLKVFVIPTCRLAAVLRHEARPLNFPADGEVLGFHSLEPIKSATGVALLVHSKAYPEAPACVPLPVVTAVFAKGEAA